MPGKKGKDKGKGKGKDKGKGKGGPSESCLSLEMLVQPAFKHFSSQWRLEPGKDGKGKGKKGKDGKGSGFQAARSCTHGKDAGVPVIDCAGKFKSGPKGKSKAMSSSLALL